MKEVLKRRGRNWMKKKKKRTTSFYIFLGPSRPTLPTFILPTKGVQWPCHDNLYSRSDGRMMMKELTIDYIIKIRKNNDPSLSLSFSVRRQNRECN